MANKKLNIYIYNTLCSKRLFNNLFENYSVTSGNATQTFFSLLAEGLVNNENVSVNVNSLLPINSKDQRKVFWKSQSDVENGIIYKSIPLINISIIRNVWVSIYVFFHILLYRFPSDVDNVIVVDFLRFSLNLPVTLACKIRGIKILTVITDMPGKSIKKQSIIGKIRNKLAFILSYDFYVCVTKQLNEEINKKNKPFVIIESFANIDLVNFENTLESKYKEFVFIYAGGLYERYGLRNFIEAFRLFPNQNLRLWFYGFGPFEKEIKKYSEEDSRIQYKGIIPNQELIQIMMKATLLINPRPTHEVYTKFSFPSKNLEYMSTGTPLLTTKLAGIPSDHFPYIYAIDKDNIEGIKDSLTYIFTLTKSEIHHFGVSTKEFVLKEKNNIKQGEKIVQIIEETLNFK